MDKYTFEINAGATFRHTIVPSVETAGVRVPYDLTGATVKLYIRDARHVRFAEYTLDVDGSEILVELSPSNTGRFVPHRRYYYIIDITYPSGDVERILDGPLRVRPFTTGVLS